MKRLLLIFVHLAAMAGEPPASLHFKPHDHALGDVHPYFKGGECFLFSLKPGGYDSVLARSKDWLHWTETPITHTPVMTGDWFAPYFVLGVFRDDAAGVYRSFHGHAKGRMVGSVSGDLLHWSCAPKEFSVPPGDYYERRRDPFVFWIPERRAFGCVMTTWMKGRTKETGGAVSLATSPDLQQWKDHGPIIDPGDIGEPECPQMFELGARWYLLASIYDRAVGKPVYWRGDSPAGPWKPTPHGQLDGKDLCAAQIAFDGDQPVLFGWIPLKPARPGRQHWGGHLALPREVFALPDGSLATRLPKKLERTFDSLSWKAVADSRVDSVPAEARLEQGALIVRTEISVPAAGLDARVGFLPLGRLAVSQTSIRLLDTEDQCWGELPARFSEGQQLKVQLVVEGDIAEVFVDERLSLAARLPRKPGAGGLRLQLDDKSASVTNTRYAIWPSR